MNLRLASFALLALLINSSALADEFDRDGVRAETYCYPASHAAKTITQLAKLKPGQRDVVAINIAPRFLIYDGGSLPERYYVTNGDEAVDFTISPDGQVPDFVQKVIAADKDANLCIQDPARVGLDADDESLYFEMGLTPFFNNISGRHTMDELAEGAKDGKAHYKKMVPSAVRAFMPDTKCLHIKYTSANTSPEIYAETPTGLQLIEGEYYNEGYVITLKQIDAYDATALIIKGGAYKLSPVPSIKTMKRFGVGKPRGPQKIDVETN
ncbi:MAG: hypothetical protein ABJ275_09185 [Maricaulaceae bacterium]